LAGTGSWSEVLGGLVAGESLTEDQAASALDAIMNGAVDPIQMGAFLAALRAKGETAAEVAGLVRTMIAHAESIPADDGVVDTCGTGGDGAGTFNISTVSALVVAAAGVPVAKHGNRAASSLCGSADLLEQWGIAIDLPPVAAARSLAELGITFLYARTYHPAMRHVAPVRSALGIPTVFNVLGPLTNPARVSRQVVGVADDRLAPVVAEALRRLGHRHALVLRSEDGLDELTTTAPSRVWEVRQGETTEWVLDPTDLGFAAASVEDLAGGDAAENRAIADEVLSGGGGPRGDVVTLNAGAGLYVGGVVPDLTAGIELARDVLASGAPAELRDRWAERSQQLADVA
jgi:anthranilate phosphoribosyltransferase